MLKLILEKASLFSLLVFSIGILILIGSGAVIFVGISLLSLRTIFLGLAAASEYLLIPIVLVFIVSSIILGELLLLVIRVIIEHNIGFAEKLISLLESTKEKESYYFIIGKRINVNLESTATICIATFLVTSQFILRVGYYGLAIEGIVNERGLYLPISLYLITAVWFAILLIASYYIKKSMLKRWRIV